MSAKARLVLVGAVGMALGLLLIALIVVLTGSYNVAATDRHNPLVGWALTTTMKNSVESRAGNRAGPPTITPAMNEAGAGPYKAMCAHCHGGVGEGRAIWAQTMRPAPPALARAAAQWSDEEVFWIVKHGVKMSGMPAFGPTHDDDDIWEIAAFVKQLPSMSAERYAAYEAGHGGHDHGDGEQETAASGPEDDGHEAGSGHSH